MMVLDRERTNTSVIIIIIIIITRAKSTNDTRGALHEANDWWFSILLVLPPRAFATWRSHERSAVVIRLHVEFPVRFFYNDRRPRQLRET